MPRTATASIAADGCASSYILGGPRGCPVAASTSRAVEEVPSMAIPLTAARKSLSMLTRLAIIALQARTSHTPLKMPCPPIKSIYNVRVRNSCWTLMNMNLQALNTVCIA